MSSDFKSELPTPTPEDAGAVFAMMTAHWKSQAMFVVTNADIPDILLKNGPQTAEQLAPLTGFKAPFLYRLMRALSADDSLLFVEDSDKRFSLSARSMLLLNQERSMKWFTTHMLEPASWRAVGLFKEGLETGEVPFDLANKMSVFEYYKEHPESGEPFRKAMHTLDSNDTAVDSGFDFSGVNTLLDVGGCSGLLLANVLKANPSIKKGILFDQAHALPPPGSDVYKNEPRIEACPGDFFDASTVPAADCIMLKHIVHDWPTPKAVEILKNSASNMAEDGRILLIEKLIPSAGDSSAADSKWLDVWMMGVCGGMERTKEEFAALFQEAGLELVKIHEIPHKGVLQGMAVIEGKRA
mmetsp:Transcript_6858/g.17281  ORF Transcript_6858/g.17281 Transcript_6858/m.17281 type:complete len:355 (-) Transcript_6858:86-1150(-)|eukprot:CAMPEP_0174235142 /NCGR_PEP_ID=MMETSP0417-20130205/4680_1 /TAXON_ID=242541 /ORGANISM="Mayorella sp, Strain BSH-02190019" /LENGTH=354 /DNA_ID=CAMNT_0015313605 /DNA_START=49 /DNA_END=1113 /DNA_ORIENTATION=-